MVTWKLWNQTRSQNWCSEGFCLCSAPLQPVCFRFCFLSRSQECLAPTAFGWEQKLCFECATFEMPYSSEKTFWNMDKVLLACVQSNVTEASGKCAMTLPRTPEWACALAPRCRTRICNLPATFVDALSKKSPPMSGGSEALTEWFA